MSTEPSKPTSPTAAEKTPKDGDLRVWHIPQIPGDPFLASVANVPEAVKVLQLLWDYDYFQLEQRIKPDYSNASGLEIYQVDGWEEWHDPETDQDAAEIAREQYRKHDAIVTGTIGNMTVTGRIPSRKPPSGR